MGAGLEVVRLDESGLCALLWLLSRSPGPPASLVCDAVSRLDELSASAGGVVALSRLGAGRVAKTLSALADLCAVHRAPSPLVSRLCDAAAARASEFSAQHASTSLWALGQLGAHEQGGALSALCGALVRTRDELRVTNAINCLWALARLGFRECGAQTLEALEACLARGAPLSGKQGASAAYALGSLHGARAPVSSPGLAACVDALSREGASLSAPGAAANALWGLAQLRLPPAVCGVAVSSLASNGALSSRGSAQDVATAVCSLAHMGRSSGAVLDRALESCAPSLSGRSVSDALWAYARMGHDGGAMATADHSTSSTSSSTGGLFAALDEAVVRTAPTMSRRDAAVAVWAYGKLGRQSESALGALARALCRLDREQREPHRAQDISMWLVSLARLSFADTDALRVLDREVERQAPAMGPQALANSLYGYAYLRRGSEAALQALDEAIARAAPTLSAHHAAIVLWAYASLGRRSEALPVIELAIASLISAGDLPANNARTIKWALLRLADLHDYGGLDVTLISRLGALVPPDRATKPAAEDVQLDYDDDEDQLDELVDKLLQEPV